MALGNNEHIATSKVYLSIAHGKVVRGSGTNKQLYSFVDGALEAIYQKSTTFGNEVVNRWYMDLRDGGIIYSLCFPYSSGVFKSIILSLASDEALTQATPIRIEPYEGKNGYTKVVVYSEGVRLDWITKQLPEQKEVTVGGKTIKDDSEQMAYICSLVESLIRRIGK